MKKILFLQNKNSGKGGVWFVHKMLSKSFMLNNFCVEFLSIRKNFLSPQENLEGIKSNVVNENKIWERVHLNKVFSELKKHNLIKFFILFCQFINDFFLLKLDKIKTKKIIKQSSPDIIICSHYELLNFIPKKYLNKVIMLHHTSFTFVLNNTSNFNIYSKYKEKVKFVWLSKSIYQKAIEYGFHNSYVIHNPCKLYSKKRSNVQKNKKLISVCRFAPEKQLDILIKSCDELLKKHLDWSLEIYGGKNLDDETDKIVNSNPNITYMGETDDLKEVYLSSSIYLSTSSFEGFPLSIIEANECGVPAVTLNFGESVTDVVLQNETGYIIFDNNLKIFEEKIETLINDSMKLEFFSKNSKKYAEKFNVETVTNEWLKLISEMEELH